MDLGFTGTQEGMTQQQKDRVLRELTMLGAQINVVRHGGCIGADEQFHAIVLSVLHFTKKIVVYPGDTPQKRMGWQEDGALWMGEKRNLERNKTIVDLSDLMIACPAKAHEIRRSGTWSTIRYARKTDTEVWIILPSGLVVPQ